MAKTAEELKELIGKQAGISDWLTIDQKTIDTFADATHDHNFIHVDPVAAAKTPFGGTIAHGLLSLSMLPMLAEQIDVQLKGAVMALNYGFDKVRMMAPVRSGKRIRGCFNLKDIVERGPGQWMLTFDVTIEIEGENKPAVMAEWLFMQIVK